MARPEPMTMQELLALPPVLDLRTAGRALRLGRDKMYRYAAAGAIPGDPPVPVQKYGSEYRVSRPHLFAHLGLPPDALSEADITPPQADAA